MAAPDDFHRLYFMLADNQLSYFDSDADTTTARGTIQLEGCSCDISQGKYSLPICFELNSPVQSRSDTSAAAHNGCVSVCSMSLHADVCCLLYCFLSVRQSVRFGLREPRRHAAVD